ncbi:MAG: hypothetical protein AAGC55_25790, partial [Myxococcota bacterium]
RATAVLDRDKAGKLTAMLASAPHELGPALFRILFGVTEQWQPVLRQVFDQTGPDHAQPSPIYGRGVRVHIVTSEPTLIALPWRLTTWHDQLLLQHGWRFVITAAAEPPGRHEMEFPDQIIAIAPRAAETSAPVPVDAHLRALSGSLRPTGSTGQHGSAVRRVHCLASLETALRGSKAGQAIVYAFAATAQHAGQPCMVLDGADGPEPVEMHKLVKLLRDHRPRLVYLNTGGVALTDPLGQAEIPLVIWRRTSGWSPDSAPLAIAWLQRWLLDSGPSNRDPVDAFHECCAQLGITQSGEAATAIVRSHYDTWTTVARASKRTYVAPVKALDRDEPKALIAKHVGELARSESQRVLAIVAHAEHGNRLADLWDQMRYYLNHQGERVFAINWKTVTFPELVSDRAQLAIDLPVFLDQDLDRQPGERIDAMLRRHAPPFVRGEARRVLWLNWGVLRRPERKGKDKTKTEKPLSIKAALTEWLTFVSTSLVTDCPDDVRIVAYVARETPKSGLLSE